VSAFKLTDVNSAAILNQTNTIFVVIFASLILKEPFTLRRLMATILAMTGSVMVLLG
jgi:drug/metabolite transporter (DMT)-like permease